MANRETGETTAKVLPPIRQGKASVKSTDVKTKNTKSSMPKSYSDWDKFVFIFLELVIFTLACHIILIALLSISLSVYKLYYLLEIVCVLTTSIMLNQ